MRNKKALLGAFVIAMLVAIIGVSSFFPFIIDPSRWMTADFLTKEIIIVVITISGIVTAMFIGRANNDADARSEIAKARVRFNETSAKVKGDPNRFRQWVSGPMQERDILAKRARLCAKFGIEDDAVFSLDRTEVKKLAEGPQRFDGKTYASLTKEQVKFVLSWKNGECSIDFVDPSYYLTVSSIRSNLTRSEKAGGESRDKAIILGSTTISKVVVSLIVGITFASLVYDSAMAEDKAQMATAWITFASRMMSLISSVFSGYMLGYKINDVEAEYINLRCDVHEDYLADKSFTAKTAIELAEESLTGGNDNGNHDTDVCGQDPAR